MTKFYFIRHGEADIKEYNSKIYKNRGQDMITLSKKGIEQINNTANDERLKKAQIIITSPFGRALHSAAILSKRLGIDIAVETDLHEWQPDSNYDFLSSEDAMNSFIEFSKNSGIKSENSKYNWETIDSVKKRVDSVLNKYKKYDEVIVVCHGVVIKCYLGVDEINNGQIVEYNL